MDKEFPVLIIIIVPGLSNAEALENSVITCFIKGWIVYIESFTRRNC